MLVVNSSPALAQPLMPSKRTILCIDAFPFSVSSAKSANHAAARVPRPREEPGRWLVSKTYFSDSRHQLTTIPNDLRDPSGLRDGVQRWYSGVQALGRKIDGTGYGPSLLKAKAVSELHRVDCACIAPVSRTSWSALRRSTSRKSTPGFLFESNSLSNSSRLMVKGTLFASGYAACQGAS